MLTKTLFTFLSLSLALTLKAQVLVGVELNGKMGYVDTNGAWVIQPQFEDVDDFYHGYAVIYKGDYEGLIDGRGNVVIPPKYDIMGFVEDGMIDIDHKDKIMYFNLEQRRMLPGKWEYGDEFEDGYASVENKQGKCGIINRNGDVVIPFEYDDIFYLEDDTFWAEIDDQVFYVNPQNEKTERKKSKYKGRKRVTKDDVKKKIKEVNPDKENLYISDVGHRQNKVYWYKASGSKYGLADTSGQLITEPIYDEIQYFTEGLAPTKKGELYGFINEEGKMVIEPIYEKVKYFSYGLAAVKKDGKWGFIDHNGIYKIQPIYDYTTSGFFDVNTDRLLLYKYHIDYK